MFYSDSDDDDDDDDDYYYYQHECETCNRVFNSQHAAGQHMNALGHWAPTFDCETCNREFTTQNGANQHMNALDHWSYPYECDYCNNKYRSNNAAESHMIECRFRPSYECEACNNIYVTEREARAHMDSEDHWRRGHHCAACDRNFQTENNLKQHLHSKIHQGQTISCPFCRAPFTTASGVAHHLEQSACPSARGLSRTKIHAELRKRDPQGLITQRLLTYPGSDSETIATPATWNGYSYECYLCHRAFGKLSSLNQHLESPAHKQTLYRCPNSRKCGKEFVTLAGLFNHLESESCSFMRFEKVGNAVGWLLNPNSRKMIGFA